METFLHIIDDFFDILIWVAIIIANIAAAIIKIRHKQKGNNREKNVLPQTFAPTQRSEQDNQMANVRAYDQKPAQSKPVETYYTCKEEPEVSAPSADEVIENPVLQTISIQPEPEDHKENDFDYAEFIRTHGKEAFIMAEIILPANSRQGKKGSF